MSKLKIIKDEPKADRDRFGQFVKGQSGNPSGRPRRASDLAAKCGEFTDEIIFTLVTILRDKKSSRRDKMEASKMLWDRGYGRPTQSMTISGDSEAPIATTQLTTEQYADIVAAAKEVDDDV